MGRISGDNLLTAIYSSLYSAIFATAIYFITNKIYFFLNPQIMRERIKISRLQIKNNR